MYNPDEYLTEDGLYEFLLQFLKEDEIIRQFRVPGTRCKVDFYIPKYKLAIEFNGFYHFTNYKQQERDVKVGKILDGLGMKFLEIPYFIQAAKEIFAGYIPEKDLEDCKFSNYPHGFVDKKAIRPRDFNTEGVMLLYNMLYKNTPYMNSTIKDAIWETIDYADAICLNTIEIVDNVCEGKYFDAGQQRWIKKAK